jgi:hypothetical protein
MRLLILAAAFVLSLAQLAWAQSTPTGTPVAVVGTAKLPPGCLVVSTDSNGLPYCSQPIAGPAGPQGPQGVAGPVGPTGPQGPAGTGSGGGCNWLTTTITGPSPYALVPSDTCHTRIWKGASALQVAIPAPASLGTSFVASLQTEGAPITLVKATGAIFNFEGSPLTINHGDNPMCPQVDDQGVCDIQGGAVSSIVNTGNLPQ